MQICGASGAVTQLQVRYISFDQYNPIIPRSISLDHVSFLRTLRGDVSVPEWRYRPAGMLLFQVAEVLVVSIVGLPATVGKVGYGLVIQYLRIFL